MPRCAIRTLLLISALCAAVPAFATWRGEAQSSNGPSGRAAAFDAAMLKLSREIGHLLAVESKSFRLYREEEYSFGDDVGAEIARVWLVARRHDLLRSQYSEDGNEYTCEISLAGEFPSLATVRRDLLTDRTLADRRIHPLILCELAADDEERERVKLAFIDRLDSPVLSDYFLCRKISAYSPSAAYELHQHKELLSELPPPQLLDQLRTLPGNLSIMKKLVASAKAAGRTRTAAWLDECAMATRKEPKDVTKLWPRIAARSRSAREFVTPALKWFYGPRRIFGSGSILPPEDLFFTEARKLENVGRYREAYEQYLLSIDLMLSYDACLGASECASHVQGLSAEADFFLLQAVVIDRDRQPARQRLDDIERLLQKGEADD